MISDREIEAKAGEFGIRAIDVEKDYVYGWLLKGIYSRPFLAQQLVLKGGNALRKGYLPDTRFSKDLDFSALGAIGPHDLERELKELCTLVERETEVEFLDRTTVRQKDLAAIGVDALEARLYFKGFFGEENLSLRTQLDITQFDKIYLPVQTRALLHPYSDNAACTIPIRCHKLEEILASKLTTLLHRRKPIDLFDLLYAVVFRNEYGVVRREVITTFIKKSIFEPNPTAAKQELLAVPLDEFREQWTTITAPSTSLFAFEFVLANFAALIDSFFALLAVQTAGGGAPGGGGLAPGLTRRGLATAPLFSGGHFPSAIRSTILSAGRRRTMVMLLYDGYERLVEPYKLEYYVRKSDGLGSEYFWGYDTTGGRTGSVGIKQFHCHKIQAARATDRTFSPRYAVEL